MARIKVTINKKGHIPGLGVGPIRRPVLITQELCDHLLKLGYPVKIINSPIEVKINKVEEVKPFLPKELSLKEIKQAEEIVKQVEEETKEELVAEETVEVPEEPAEEAVIENNEEKVTEDVEEILMNDPDLSAEAFYTEDFLTSKALCKKILSNRQVQYENSSSFALLKKLVLDSNPEVELEEETIVEE